MSIQLCSLITVDQNIVIYKNQEEIHSCSDFVTKYSDHVSESLMQHFVFCAADTWCFLPSDEYSISQ